MYVIEKALQGTCLNMNWCEVLFSLNLPYLNSIIKEAEKVALKLNENYLNIPSVSTTKRISILIDRYNKLEVIRSRKLR